MITLAKIGGFVLSPLGLKIGLGAALAVGAYSWHTSALRNAKQQQEAETRAEVVTELEAQHAIETKKYEERVTELEQRFNVLAKTRAASKQIIEVITKQAEVQRAEVQNMDVNAVRAAIRQHLAGTATTGTDAR